MNAAPPSSPVRLTILQGEAKASADPAVEMTTILGSCVATCLYDPLAKVGGMNHFLLGEPSGGSASARVDGDYGLYLMEVLINDMLAQGALKQRLRARLYGGGNLNPDLGAIGSANARFAREFLRKEGIEKAFEDLEGTHARRVDFRPATGQVRCRRIAETAAPTQKPQARPSDLVGGVELF
ncbi:chemotaxis protein CheD [Erythrobacter sp.]|jgi:chemotaxis protein CheD|uniref:chemotaxis protein CheD n=1 Tax=Erythrobacter sp. TaxID=1042 RepID=UPI002EBBC7DA|nr:chemotaxis protein CheD [Erythrobacter sp.]